MAAPLLTLLVEPTEGAGVNFLQLAPPENGAAQTAHVALSLGITNNEAGTINVNHIEVSYAGGPAVSQSFPSPAGNSHGWAITFNIGPGATGWAFFEGSNHIVVPMPAPASITVKIFCDTFVDAAGNPDPFVATLPLQRHVSPVAGGYRFPAKTDDLGSDEFWRGIGAAHASGWATQLFAHDLGVFGDDGWTDRRPGTDGSQNDHWRCYGKNVCAMAAGNVVAWDNTIADNNPPGGGAPAGTPVLGSHFWIQHGADIVVYAHLQGATMDTKLMVANAPVTEGQFLGKCGNSGNTTAPHLHIHAQRGTTPFTGAARPIAFRDTACLRQSRLASARDNGPWARMDDTGIPNVLSLIYPDGAGPPQREESIIDRIIETVTEIVDAIKRFFGF